MIDDHAAAKVVGQGAHRYRFLLLDPRTGQVATYRPFVLLHETLDDLFGEGEGPYAGVTDALGRTPVFAFDAPVDPAGWTLLERFGQGEFGDRFLPVTGQDDTFPGTPYVIAVCSEPVRLHFGVTDGNGSTAWIGAAKPLRTQVSILQSADADEAYAEFIAGGASQRSKDAIAYCAAGSGAGLGATSQSGGASTGEAPALQADSVPNGH